MLPSHFKRWTDESEPLVIDPHVATLIGLNESIVIRQLHFWLRMNEKKGEKKGNYYDGKYWCYNSISDWRQNNFPFWSESTIKRIFGNLKDAKLIETMNNPKEKWDRTNWYTIDYAEYAKLFSENSSKETAIEESQASEPLHQVNLTQWTNPSWPQPSGQSDPMYNIYTESTAEKTTKKKEPIQNLKLEEYKNNPLFERNKNLKFPDLTSEEIDLEFESYHVSYPNASFTSITNFLANQNTRKLETENKKNWYKPKEQPNLNLKNEINEYIIKKAEYQTEEELDASLEFYKTHYPQLTLKII